MMLAYDRKRITRDIDAVFYPNKKVQPLIEQVAREQRLPDNWINDDVRQFLATQESKRTLPIELPGLQVTIPTAGYLLAKAFVGGLFPDTKETRLIYVFLFENSKFPLLKKFRNG